MKLTGYFYIPEEDAKKLGGAVAKEDYTGNIRGRILYDYPHNVVAIATKLDKDSKLSDRTPDPTGMSIFPAGYKITEEACVAYDIRYGKNLTVDKEVEIIDDLLKRKTPDTFISGYENFRRNLIPASCGFTASEYETFNNEQKKEAVQKLLDYFDKNPGRIPLHSQLLPPTALYIPIDVVEEAKKSGSTETVTDYIEKTTGIRPDRVLLSGDFKRKIYSSKAVRTESDDREGEEEEEREI